MSARPALPVSLSLRGRRCVVVGEDPDPARLRTAGAEISSIGAADYRAEALEGAFVVFCFDAALAPEVSRDALAAHALCYVPDRPELSDFAMPAVARRGVVAIAASTDGAAPALARRLREELQRLLDEAPALDRLAEEMIREREAHAAGPDRATKLRALAATLRIDGAIRIALEHA